MRGKKAPLEVRFWERVAPAEWDECWLWTGAPNSSGYGQIGAGGATGRNLRAHRVAYELLIGEIPAGLVLDHLCRVRMCVNPWHLDVVSPAENVKRGEVGRYAAERQRSKTTCPQGHPYDEVNTVRDRAGNRRCRACARAASLAYYYKRKATG